MSRTILIANPGADVYGSDLQLLRSVAAFRKQDWKVVVATATNGPLVPLLRELGAIPIRRNFPVLRRSSANLRSAIDLGISSLHALRTIGSTIHAYEPDLVYVNTITLPWWLLAGRAARTPTLCHVHEAERSDPRFVRSALAAPLRLATTCMVNSRATADVIGAAQPALAGRMELIHNGVAGPPAPLRPPTLSGRIRLIVVGRLSHRKGPHVAVDAVERLIADGYDVELVLCGSAFDPDSDYTSELEARSTAPAVAGRVTLSGYTSPIWPALEQSDILIAPSFGESFGNAVVEAQLAGRPVVATAVQGHLETVAPERTGLLVPLDNASAIASAVARLIDDPPFARRLANAAQRTARELFSTERYESRLIEIVRATTLGGPSKTVTDGAERS